tara:strand:- start:240 stop:692 length:453 start_codon:yes stop_codon:yes gene_type:complete
MSRLWATPTWYFFHTFAEKIQGNFYRANSWKCFSIIKHVCHNLPCGYCRSHAVRWVSSIHPRDVSTREDLKFVLFTFHNDVNRRLGKRIFKYDELKIYRRANTRKLFQYFFQQFNRTYMSGRDFSGWRRNTATNKVQSFLNRNRRWFLGY